MYQKMRSDKHEFKTNGRKFNLYNTAVPLKSRYRFS